MIWYYELKLKCEFDFLCVIFLVEDGLYFINDFYRGAGASSYDFDDYDWILYPKLSYKFFIRWSGELYFFGEIFSTGEMI